MAKASQDKVELPQTEYPVAFRRVGAGRVFFSLDSVEIWRGGLASEHDGIIIYANGNRRAINSGATHETRLSNRIFEFQWN